ncbi:MAG: DUF882 domain-containing protein [Pseudomonadota bacterium]
MNGPGATGHARLAAVLVAFACMLVSAATPAHAEKRTLKLFNTHTHETITVTYKKNGRFIPSALRELNRFLRDWRRNEATKMDPELFDLVWEVYKKTGAKKPIHVVSAYRSPATNNMLRKRSRGVARKSQHTQGKAMDFFIPGVSVAKLRAAGLRQEIGGVGYYPRSRSPFVHMDTGRVRHWPRMTRKQLARVFPDGKTIHIPSDGKPMPRYKQALAALNRRESRGSRRTFARERTPRREERQERVQVARNTDRDESRTTRNNRPPAPVASISNPVSDSDDVVLRPGRTAAEQTAERAAESGGNPFNAIVSRFGGRTPPKDVPQTADGNNTPSRDSGTAPGVRDDDPAGSDETVVATTPLSKPGRAPEVPAIVLAAVDANRQIEAGTTLQGRTIEPASALATATPQSTGPTSPLNPGATTPGDLGIPAAATVAAGNQTPLRPALGPAPTSDNPADYVTASLPPRTRSFGPGGDPVDAVNLVIPDGAPKARPLIEPQQPPLLAYAAPGGPIQKPTLSDRNPIVSSVPRPALRSRQAAETGTQTASLTPQVPAAETRRPAARAMPMIGDLRSLLDATQPFQMNGGSVGLKKFLTTNATTRNLVFADLMHPSVDTLLPYLEKPQRVLKRQFAEGFQSELRTDRFTGTAIGAVQTIYTR